MLLDSFFKTLHGDMMSRTFLKKNPVIVKTAESALSSQELGEVIRQYVCFPEVIVQMLKGAASRFSKTSAIQLELERNWLQEEGSETGGVSHVALLKHALKRDLNLDAEGVVPAISTKIFLSSVLKGMEGDPWFALGQAYGLEASAIPELSVLVGPAINAYAESVGIARPIRSDALRSEGGSDLSAVKTSAEAYGMNMSTWFAFHILDFEVGHRDMLRECASKGLAEGGDQSSFEHGFKHVLAEMDAWWLGLSEGR